ncbi:MAG: hypothetical protein QM764_22625 [Chitinophagaceae bacterium]
METNFTYKNLTYMKRFMHISLMAFMIMLLTGLRNNVSAQPDGDVTYQDFYDDLSPYGRWIDYPEYGYVWCPDEGADFRPYSTNGHWVWNDDYEWMWVSDYSWGWAPFHYGRWFYDDMYGWMWMPGYEWSPAWVAWRGGGDYYGWAPLRPGFSISVGFSSYAPPYNYWCFAPSRYITSPRIYDYCVSFRENLTIINRTTIINNYNYNRNVFVTGPRRMDAERFTNGRINSVNVRDISRPGRAGFRNNEVSIYRPSVRRENNTIRTAEPRRFDEYRGNNAVARNDRRNGFNNRADANNNRFDNRNADQRNNFNDRFNQQNAQRQDNNRFQQQQNNSPAQRDNSPRSFDQRNDRNNDWLNQRNNQAQQQRNDNNNATRERSVRDAFGQDNRRGFDRPVDQNRFQRSAPVRSNDNFNRDNNRSFQNNSPQTQQQPQRREAFNNRSFNQPQQQRQSFPEMRRQEQPRQFSQPNNGGNNGHGFGRGRRG